MTLLPPHDDDAPFDLPTKAQLVAAVRSWIDTTLSAELAGAQRFHARVASNMLAIVERELDLGTDIVTSHRSRLSSLGVSSDRELADAIRSGALDHRHDEVLDAVAASLRDELAVTNPGYTASETRFVRPVDG